MPSWPGRRGSGRGWWIALVIILALVVVGRLVTPYVVKTVVNKKLETMPGGYQGSVEDVVVRMFDGEIGLQNFRIVKKNGLVPVPFMVVKELVLGTVRDSWKLRTTLRFVEPNGSIVDAESEARKQQGPEKALDRLQSQLPFQLLRAEVQHGQFHFRNFQTKPDVDAYVEDLNLVWDKLVGCLPPGGSACRSNLEADADVMKSGKLKVKGTFARSPEIDFHADVSIDNLRVPELNPVLAEYAKVDVKKGKADIDVRYDRRGQNHDILMVPRLTDFEVVSDDAHEGMKFGRELAVAGAAGYFERKKGEKAVSIKKKASGKTDFALIDLPSQKD